MGAVPFAKAAFRATRVGTGLGVGRLRDAVRPQAGGDSRRGGSGAGRTLRPGAASAQASHHRPPAAGVSGPHPRPDGGRLLRDGHTLSCSSRPRPTTSGSTPKGSPWTRRGFSWATEGCRRRPPRAERTGSWSASQPRPARGLARLTLRYHGSVDVARSRGIYRVDEDKTAYLYTFFEAVDARRAFPCFDEPVFKIPWTLSLTVPEADQAFANTPVVSTTAAGPGLKTLTFAETRPLPSYLVAFVVGPFQVVPGSPAGNEGLPVQFILPQGRAAELRYAQEFLPHSVKLLEDFTGVPYPYGKLDVAVVPRYWGTMEHPGLVALGQSILLIPPGQESLQRRQFAANISTHELAHYWFGDLVTNAWWDDTWLNEALGTWLDLKATDAVDPAFRFQRVALARRSSALAADALPTAKAVRQPVLSRTDIDASFDAALTYDKGSIVLGMFERWVGAPAFRRGLQLYLKRYADKTATAEELFRALDEGTDRPVGNALSTFVVQPGAPLVSVSLRCTTGDLPVLELAQERFWAERSVSQDTATWQLPVCVRAAWGKHVERACILLTDAQAELTLPYGGCPTFVTANEGGLGYYRVAYAPALRASLLAHQGELDAVELASLRRRHRRTGPPG